MNDETPSQSPTGDVDQHEDISTAPISTKEWGAWFFRYRDYSPIPLIILALLLARPSAVSATLGLLAVIFGEAMRIYNVAFIGSISRTRSDTTGQSLITGGCFRYMRNPLYVGNFFIALGFAIYSGSQLVVILTVTLTALQYHFIVEYEEATLKKKFGQEYLNYLETVPRWFPKKWPRIEELDWPDTFKDAIQSEKRTLTAILAVTIALMLVSL